MSDQAIVKYERVQDVPTDMLAHNFVGSVIRAKGNLSIIDALAKQLIEQLRAWHPIETYKKDGTLVLLLVDADQDGGNSSMPTEDALTYRTIGHNNCDNDCEDQWRFAGWCWSHDHFVEGRGAPTHWMPLPAPLADTQLNTPPDERA